VLGQPDCALSTLFISDLHLDPSRPHITQTLLRFLDDVAGKADNLYILGDLFEAWIGDDDDSPLAQTVADGLHAVSDRGTSLAFMHGNRDFLLGETYAQRCGMRLLQQAEAVSLGPQRALLMHGDTLCTSDVAYQRFRAQVRTSAWQSAFLQQPLEVRRQFANSAREESKRYANSADSTITDVENFAVRQVLHQHAVTLLIHGHTHRPAIHTFDHEHAVAQRVVLGDWYEQGSVLHVDDAGDMKLLNLQIP
jgi:UDP-2,3-diacylglucosamine hydrolase